MSTPEKRPDAPTPIPEGVKFAPIPPELLAVPGVTLAHVRVWSHVWLQTLGRPDWTLSYRQLGDAASISKESAKRAVRSLAAHGWLTVEHRQDDAGDQAASLILCAFPEGVGSRMTTPRVTDDLTGGVTDDHHQKNHHQKKPVLASTDDPAAAPKGAPKMDDATWLAAELDATPTACQAAIDHKSGEADRRGRPWHNRRRMIRDVIPLDEWRDLVSQLEQKSKPKPKPVISGECGDPNHPAGKHVVETDQHRIVCWGPAA